MIEKWLEAMGVAGEMDFMTGLRGLQPEGGLIRWSLCAGTGISSHIARVAAEVLSKRLPDPLEFQTA
eukprot:3721277-Karenia_brevis.AAC.1